VGILKMFGVEKEERAVFRVPREVVAFRNRIEAEIKENYPSIVSYKEIVREAHVILKALDSHLLNESHAKELAIIHDNLTSLIEQLSVKIKKNFHGRD